MSCTNHSDADDGPCVDAMNRNYMVHTAHTFNCIHVRDERVACGAKKMFRFRFPFASASFFLRMIIKLYELSLKTITIFEHFAAMQYSHRPRFHSFSRRIEYGFLLFSHEDSRDYFVFWLFIFHFEKNLFFRKKSLHHFYFHPKENG